MNCNICEEILAKWRYRYQGKIYCRSCTERFFELKICQECNKKKYINKKLSKPICKICQVKNSNCIKCGTKKNLNGKITEEGVICKKCAKYFKEFATCSKCNKSNAYVFNRKISNKKTKLLCQNCYQSFLPTCIHCKKQRPIHKLLTSNQSICRICFTEKFRICQNCKNSFPAGIGRICNNCRYTNTIKKKLLIFTSQLSVLTKNLFNEFSFWLEKRRGVLYTATSLNTYYLSFKIIDELSTDKIVFPTYKELLEKFSTLKNKNYLLILKFLEEFNLIKRNLRIQNNKSNMNLISKYLTTFPKDTYEYEIIRIYFNYLEKKLLNKQTTIRSIRLSLTCVVKCLKYKNYFKNIHLDNEVLESYLWVYPGQKASITGFIHFINTFHTYNLELPKNKKPLLTRPITSNAFRKQKYINLLRNKKNTVEYKNKLLYSSIEFLHDIYIPVNVFIRKENIKKDKNKNTYVLMAGYKFYLN